LSRIKQEISYRAFGTAAELDQLVQDDLATLLSERFAAVRPAPGAQRGSGPISVRLPLPVDATSLVGRETAIQELAGLGGRPGGRSVALAGPGGGGKPRLAVAVGERLSDRFGACRAFVPLASATQAEQVLTSVGRTVRAELGRTGSALESLAERFGETPWLLILDNVERVVDAAPDVDALLTRCPRVSI